MFNFKKIILDFWSKKDDIKSDILNSLIFRTDTFLDKIIHQVTAIPPVTPVEGDVIRIISPASGRFTGNENNLTYYYNGSWRIVEAQEGWIFFDRTLGKPIYFDGSVWRDLSGTACPQDHNELLSYDKMEHIDWSILGNDKIDISRIPTEQVLNQACPHDHDLGLNYDPMEHILWDELGSEKIDISRLPDSVRCVVHDHNEGLNYDPMRHELWSDPGDLQIDISRIPRDESLVASQFVTGWPNRTDSSLAWDDATRTFTISGLYDIFYHGTRYSFTGDSIQISDTEGTHFICYIDDVLTDVLVTSHSILTNLLRNYVKVGLIYWNTTDDAALIIADERHGIVMDTETHHYLHETRGVQYFDGLEISGYTLNTDSNAAISFDLTDGEIYDEDIEIEIEDGDATNQYEQVLQGDAEIPVMYRDDVTGAWTQSAATTLPYLTAGSGRLAFNNDDGDGTWSQVEIDNNKFCVYTIIYCNDWVYPIKMVQGNSQYNTANEAEDGALQEIIDFTGPTNVPSQEIGFLYRFIMQTSNGFSGDKKAQIEKVLDLRGLNTVNFKSISTLIAGL